MGAKGDLLKTASVEEIAAGIRKAHSGEPVLDPSVTKQLFEALPLLRGFGMQGEMHPLHLHIEIPFQFFNTPGTEVTPRSNVVAKNFQLNLISHIFYSFF